MVVGGNKHSTLPLPLYYFARIYFFSFFLGLGAGDGGVAELLVVPVSFQSYAADLPGTYRRHGLGQRGGISEHLSPTHNLSQALTAGLPAKLS